eukprot:364426-Chlamydomonas_euryale.AAC.28
MGYDDTRFYHSMVASNHAPIPCERCRHIIRLSQNPASEHLGTTVWDASIVLAKYLEKVRNNHVFCITPL